MKTINNTLKSSKYTHTKANTNSDSGALSPQSLKERGKLTAELLRRFLLVTEFITRFILCNIPSYLRATSQQFDSVCCLIFGYLTFKVVAFSGAVLANAIFSVAFHLSWFLSHFITLPSKATNQDTSYRIGINQRFSRSIETTSSRWCIHIEISLFSLHTGDYIRNLFIIC